MAKASTPLKKTSSESKTKTTEKKKPSVSASSIEKVSKEVLKQLETLEIEQGLRNDIEWCLGSFHHDQNPTGLIENGIRALEVLKAEKIKNAKSVPAKLITDLEKAIKH
jgi:hypothetical protein